MKRFSLCAGLLLAGVLCGCRHAESTGAIPAREKRIPKAKLADALKRLETWGYEVKLLQYPNGQTMPEM